MTTSSPSLESAGLGARPARPRQSPFTRWPRFTDAALAVIVFALEVVGIVGQMAQEQGRFGLSTFGDVGAATYLLLAVSSVALLWRRSQPLIVLAATLAASLVWDMMDLAYGPSLAIFVSLYGVGRFIEARASVLAVIAAMLVVVADDLIESEVVSVIGLSLTLVFLAWYVGRRMRERREYLALLEERAEFLQRERDAEARRAVDEERTRISRELHDVVAHRVSMITVQAGAAQTVAADDPERAIRAMESIEVAGREALNELRQLLGVLRSASDPEGLMPVHGIADIPALVTKAKEAGIEVSLLQTNVSDAVPAGVDLASYRIVQEALTNILKHAGLGTEAEVRLSAANQMLTIEVVDRGEGEAPSLPGSGQGLVGMRERATLLGGTFEAGPRLGGGYRIMACLPLERSS
jgi:signal transduction histidine kinase